ncbi:MAG: RIP metalloprotease RseP [Nitrospirae bacterium]|nr:RIP metalloprotease RseP [Nitrospirota bacterium]
MSFIGAIVLLGVLIFVHELGHFIFAKLSGVRVLKFSLGFGPKIIGKKVGDTEYLLSAVPLGGYVKMLGEEAGEELKEEDKKWAYNYQPVGKRLGIVFAGPAFNLIFAVVLFAFIFSVGMPVLVPHIGEVLKDSPAQKAGLLKGDEIIGINSADIKRWDELTDVIHNSPGKEVTLKIKRGENVFTLQIVPERKKSPNIFGEEKEVGLIGIAPSGKTFIKKEPAHNAIADAFKKTYEIIVLTILGIIKLIQRVIPAKTIGGPILILQMAGKQASAGFLDFFVFMALISINLGILNLLPIPILDGGHILFLSIEALRGKPLKEKTMMIAQRVGMALIILLMTFALYNDILRLITGEMP